MIEPHVYLVDTSLGSLKFSWNNVHEETLLLGIFVEVDEPVVLNTPYRFKDAENPLHAAELISTYHDLGTPTNLREIFI